LVCQGKGGGWVSNECSGGLVFPGKCEGEGSGSGCHSL